MGSPLTIRQWLDRATQTLTAAAITTARLDCLVLLEHLLERDKSWLLAHDDNELTQQQLDTLDSWVQRRQTAEPLAYILGYGEFYGRRFFVTADTLQPRPESESIITLLLNLVQDNSLAVIADIGTGTGCLSITAAKECSGSTIYASDTSQAALKVAKKNAAYHQAHVTLLQGSLLEALSQPTRIDIVLANLPYVPQTYPINRAATHEPPEALYSGIDGLDHYRELFVQASARLPQQPRYIITEALSSQHRSLQTIAAKNGYTLTAQDGLAQLFTRVSPL